MSNIVIMGSSISGNLAAAYLKKHYPDLEVIVIGRTDRQRPIVGESLIEASSEFMREIGLGPLLIENHYPKYGLTYYYKTDLDRPNDRTYYVDESPAVPPFPAFQINRSTFDRDLRAHNEANGIRFLEANVTSVELGDGSPHDLTLRGKNGKESQISARWLLDATGRNRLLARKCGLQVNQQVQRDAFWFRLTNFDPKILSQIEAIKKENRAFDSYYCTHHFFGKGNWIWCIPMRPEGCDNIMSIGITYRKDLYPHRIRNIDDFMSKVALEHEVIVELIESGTVIDSNYYRNYMYEAKQRYSTQRWYLIGDAGNTVDPLYSYGLTLTCLQIEQIGQLIRQDLKGSHTAELVKDMDRGFADFHRAVTADTTTLYEVMHDSYQCHLTQHLTNAAGFHLAIPLLITGYTADPIGVKIFSRLASMYEKNWNIKNFKDLIFRASQNRNNSSVSDYIKVQSSSSLNWNFFEYTREEDLPASFAKYIGYTGVFRFWLLRRIGWKSIFQFRHLFAILRDIMLAAFVWLFFRRTKLRKSWLVRNLVVRF